MTYSKDSVVSCYHLLMYWPTIINGFGVTCDSDIIIIGYYYNPSMGRGYMYTIKVVCMGNIIACSVNVSHLFPATFCIWKFFFSFHVLA